MTDSAQTDAGPVLIAVDFSRDSDAAVEWGLRHAAMCGAPVVLFHAIHDSAESPGFYTREGQSGLSDIGKVAQEMMDAELQRVAELQRRLGTHVDVTSRLAEGLPAGRVIEVAEELGCTLIVIGSRGRRKIASLLLGSVAESVVQKAKRPVVIVKADRDARATGPDQEVDDDGRH